MVPLSFALEAVAAGYAVVPPAEDGTKRPAYAWKALQDDRPTDDQIRQWWSTPRHGIGVLTGAASDGLEMVELEAAAMERGLLPRWAELCHTSGLGEVFGRMVDGYMESTPSGGIHILFRVRDGANRPNTKLARTAAGAVLIETRGEGGYVVIAPSDGAAHPSGKAWELRRGNLASVAVLTAAERDAIYEQARALDEYRPPAATPTTHPAEYDPWPTPPKGAEWMGATIDAYNASRTWADVLVGWQVHHTAGGVTYWTRPGKDPRAGWSATTNARGTDRLIVFSTSVAGFDPWDGYGKATSYDRFGAWAVLTFGGDRITAARVLRDEGFGAGVDVPISIAAPDDPWPNPEPIAIPETRHRFPMASLPAWCVGHVEEVARRVQVPPDLPAMLAIGALSAAITGRANLDWGDGGAEPINLYLCVAMPSGAGKSPAEKLMAGWLRRWQQGRMDEMKLPHARALQRVRLAEKAQADAERTTTKGGGTMEAEAALMAVMEAREAVPIVPRLIIDDATPQAVVKLLAAHGARLALLSTEAGLFELVSDKRSRQPIDVYLKAWGGDAIHRDRTGTAETGMEYAPIARPLLTVSICAQPTALGPVVSDPYLVGRGFPQRFVYAMPESNIGRRDFANRFRGEVHTLAAFEHRAESLAEQWARWDEPTTLRASPEAVGLVIRYLNHVEARLDGRGDLGRDMADWTAKLTASVQRYAGLLHLAEGFGPDEPIGEDVARRAIALGEYWLGHVRSVLALGGVGNEVDRQALAIGEWLQRSGRDRFTLRDVQRAVRTEGLGDRAADYVDPLEVLISAGWIRPTSADWAVSVGRQGARVPGLLVNPGLPRMSRLSRPIPVVAVVAPEDVAEDVP